MRVGVLGLQGDVPEHLQALQAMLPPDSVQPVRRPSDLEDLVALFMPGGESTTIGRLLEETGLAPALRARIRKGFPVLATCAGLILLAEAIEASPGGRDPTPLGVLAVTVRRNDYGTQRESFEGPVEIDGLSAPFPGVFIRAPRLLEVRAPATPIARWSGEVVGVRQGALWGLTFHPELSGDGRVHALFLAETTGFGQRRPASHRKTNTNRTTKPTATASQ
ncbi:MAG: pyridoxal 5'-phosphate synthase glutaminase subunit PdxT [Thermoplasmata archaeon]|nr:pyridoxal 5'-phosphate synthase glutaminase subunit PdxT [Thermoplasmata archaeon]